MKRNHRRAELHRQRRMPQRRSPYVRFATVMPSGRHATGQPCLRLQGHWLAEAGFFNYWRIKVTVSGSRLVIEPLVDALQLFDEYGVGREMPQVRRNCRRAAAGAG